jgi:hypothetical protein
VGGIVRLASANEENNLRACPDAPPGEWGCTQTVEGSRKVGSSTVWHRGQQRSWRSASTRPRDPALARAPIVAGHDPCTWIGACRDHV